MQNWVTLKKPLWSSSSSDWVSQDSSWRKLINCSSNWSTSTVNFPTLTMVMHYMCSSGFTNNLLTLPSKRRPNGIGEYLMLSTLRSTLWSCWGFWLVSFAPMASEDAERDPTTISQWNLSQRKIKIKILLGKSKYSWICVLLLCLSQRSGRQTQLI